MNDGNATTIDAILKNFLEEMDKLQEERRAIIEAKQSKIPKNNA